MSLYAHTRYLTSTPDIRGAPPDRGREVAFAGRSNVGKSSVLNTVTGRRSLARTSKTPGRTRLINFFEVSGSARLVDLPGYGYARVPNALKLKWQRDLTGYLEDRRSLQGLVLVMDARHPLTEFDRQMLLWSEAAGLAVHVLLNKVDKLKRGPAKSLYLKMKTEIPRLCPGTTVQLFSATGGDGLDELHRVLDAWLGIGDTAKKNPGSR